MERDIFGRLLNIALARKSRHANLSIGAYSSGSLPDRWPDVKKLISRVEQKPISSIDVEIIDGFYAVHQLGNVVPESFDKITEKFLMNVCAMEASEIHLVFDVYISPLKTKRLDFKKSLKNYKFKETLVSFFSLHWEELVLSTNFRTKKKVFLAVSEKCFSFHCEDGNVVEKEEKQLECFHEEADTRIILNLAANLGPNLCKGKATPFNLFEKSPKIQSAFQSLLSQFDIFDGDAVDAVQEFTCLIYKVKNCKSVTEVRFQIFDKTFSNKKKR
nr:unnamed protein product [Callosobruchus analis]